MARQSKLTRLSCNLSHNLSQHKAELLTLGISEEVIESALAHKELNQVKFSYEREKATLEQKRTLLQWYEDYLNDIEDLGI